MPVYRVSQHAAARFFERFPALTPVCAGLHHEARRRIASWAQRARPIGTQHGTDVLLRLELPIDGCPTGIVLAVTPCSLHDHRLLDTWIVRTVLTDEMAERSIAQATQRTQAAGARQRRDRRCAERIRFITRTEAQCQKNAA